MDVSAIDVAVAIAIGAGLGVAFFGGLLWTVHRLSDARHPVVLVALSLTVRLAVVAMGVIWLVGRHWSLPIVAVAGFFVVRTWMLRIWGAQRIENTSE